ncbi:MAG: DUF11 domain-containing protein, partial [Planctomycetes bacterium]|nr:DUF11 domain-containing protein [Planctomycetota bacterium]
TGVVPGNDTITAWVAENEAGFAKSPTAATQTLVAEWRDTCDPWRMEISGIGMGNYTTITNPQSLSLANPTGVNGLLLAQVAGKYDGDKLPPESVTFTTDASQPITLSQPSKNSDYGYTFETNLQPSGQITASVNDPGENKTPRGLILYTKRNTKGERWTSVGKTTNNYVYWKMDGYPPPPQVLTFTNLTEPTDLFITAVVIDNNIDNRPLKLEVTAGDVTTSVIEYGPTNGDLLNIIPLTLTQVMDTDRVTVTLQSPKDNGDSLILVGLNASYQCIDPNADLAVTKTVDISSNGDNIITYTITVTNNGPSHATGVQLTDLLPPEVTYKSHITSQGDYDRNTGLWVVGDLANTASATLNIIAKVNKCTGGMLISNTVKITAADQPDSKPSNNEARVDFVSSATRCIYLPIIHKEPTICNPYGPKDHLLTKQATLTAQPIVDYANRYTVEVKVPANSKIEYGLTFGHTADPKYYYRYGIIYIYNNTIPARFRLKWQHGSKSTDSTCITENDSASYCGFADDTINTSLNHLKVECNVNTVKLYLNNKPEPVWKDNLSCSGGIGIFLQSPSLQVTGSFRDFQVSCPSDASNLNIMDSSLPPIFTVGRDSDLDD